MKIRIKSLVFMTILLLNIILSCSACKVKNSDVELYKEGMQYTTTQKGTPLPYYKRYYDITGGADSMPVGGYYGLYRYGGSVDGNILPNFAEAKYFDLISQIGVNFIVYVRNETIDTDFYEKWYQLGEEYGIGLFATDLDILQRFSSTTDPRQKDGYVAPTKEWMYDIVKKASFDFKYKSFLGIWAFDEPSASFKLELWKEICNLFYDCGLPDGYDIYCNILGWWDGLANVNNSFTGGGWTYDEYVYNGKTVKIDGEDHFIPGFMESGVQILSSTEYPINTIETDYAAISKWFQSMSKMVKIANNAGIPYWRMMQAGAIFGEVLPGQPYPLEGQFMLDFNSALAFGCKGIQYYPLNADMTSSTYQDELYFEKQGMIGVDGQVNPYWYYAKTANIQLKAIDHILMNSANVGILPHGEDAKYLIGDLNGELITDGGWRELSSVSGDDCFIGCFDYKGGTALYVVNNSCENKSNVLLKFKNRYRYDVIQRGQTISVVGTSIPLTLNPGEGVMVTLY